MSSVEKLKESINQVRYNPAAIQRLTFDLLEEISEGKIDVYDPSNPFVFLLESSSVNASAAMVHAETLTREQYPSMALTEEELYLHMSDKDFIGRFSNPSRTTFTLLLNKEELLTRVVQSEVTGVKKITIPRNTEFMVADYVFTMEYPIDIRVMSHGGIQVVYDVSKPSPLQVIETNLVDWELVRINAVEYVRIHIPVNQFKVTPHYAQLNKTAGYSKTYPLTDQYYYCRAYRKVAGKWEEIKTTHTDQVFDPFKPTVVLKVLENKLIISVPHVYISNGLLDKELRFDLYETKGALDLLLDSYEINSFSVRWREIDQTIKTTHTAPLSVFSNIALYSDRAVVGGSNSIDFNTLRERVLMNALGNASLPITNVQLTTRLANLGYRAIRSVDNITDRIYLASKQLPPPSSGSTVAGASCLFSPIQYTFDELTRLDGVIDNGDRITLTPNVLYRYENGKVTILQNQYREQLVNLEAAQFVREVNGGNLLFTPFHYVLDASDNYFSSRVYYFEDPKVNRRQFIQENDSLGLQISSREQVFLRTEKGFQLRLKTRTGQGIRLLPESAVQVQLSFSPPDERRTVYLNGVSDGFDEEGERIFVFDLETSFNINGKHEIFFKHFKMFQNEDRQYLTPLTNDFNLVYYVNGIENTGIENSKLNYQGASFLLPSDAIGITHERVTLELGIHLEGFWNNSRSIIGSANYRYYTVDVPALYEENIYEVDEDGLTKITYDESTGEIGYNLLHAKGDPILTEDGIQVFKHRLGDPMIDHEGNPIVEGERGILREADIFLMDAKHYFANRVEDVQYLREVPRTLISWLNDDIKQFREWALEKTEIYLYPQPTLGGAQAIVLENEERTINLEQSFDITFYLSRDKYDDPFVRQVLTNLAVNGISESLQRKRIRINEIVSKLTAMAGEDAIAISVSGLGGEENFSTLTLKDDLERCSIRKRLERTIDGQYQVVDDINIMFIRHEVN